MANILQANNTIGVSVAQFPTTSWAAPNAIFAAVARNDGSVYAFNAATSTVTLPASGLADGYLIRAFVEIEVTHNNRCTAHGRISQTVGTGTVGQAIAGGYARNTAEDRLFFNVETFVDKPSVLAQFQFEWRRDTGTGSPAGNVQVARIEVIPFYYSDFAIYESNSTAFTGGLTPNVLAGFSGTDGTNITLSGGDTVTVSGNNKNYLTFGSQYWEDGATNRTQRWFGLLVDAVQRQAAKAYTFFRDTSNAQSGNIFTDLIRTSTADRTLQQYVYRGDGIGNNQGGADADSGTVANANSQHMLVVLELNDSAEVFNSETTVASADVSATTTADLDIVSAFTGDAAAFTKSADDAVQAEKAMDVFLAANVSLAAGNVSNTGRFTASIHALINSVINAFLTDGDYLRNNQGTIDTFGWSANFVGVVAVALNDLIGIRVTRLVGSAAQGDPASPAGWSGLIGVNLDSLEGGVDVTAPVLTLPTGTETGETTASGSFTTDEGNGTGYGYVSTNATETAATIIANGDTVTVTATGVQNFTETGLAASTSYYYHFVHVDTATNESNVVSSTQFTTDAPDVTAPIVTGVSTSSITSTTVDVAFTTDEAGDSYVLVDTNATRSQAQVEASGVEQLGILVGANSESITGLTASTTYFPHVIVKDAAGNVASVVTGASFDTLVAPTDVEPVGTPVTYEGQGVTSPSFPALVDATADFITVSIFANNGSPTGAITCTYNGVTVPIRLDSGEQTTDGTARRGVICGLVSPSTGTNTLAITTAGSRDVWAVVRGYKNVDQTTPAEGGDHTEPTLNNNVAITVAPTTTTVAGDYLVGMVQGHLDSAVTELTTTDNLLYRFLETNNGYAVGFNDTLVTGSGDTLQWNKTSDTFSEIAQAFVLVIKAGAGGGGTTDVTATLGIYGASTHKKIGETQLLGNIEASSTNVAKKNAATDLLTNLGITGQTTFLATTLIVNSADVVSKLGIYSASTSQKKGLADVAASIGLAGSIDSSKNCLTNIEGNVSANVLVESVKKAVTEIEAKLCLSGYTTYSIGVKSNIFARLGVQGSTSATKSAYTSMQANIGVAGSSVSKKSAATNIQTVLAIIAQSTYLATTAIVKRADIVTRLGVTSDVGSHKLGANGSQSTLGLRTNATGVKRAATTVLGRLGILGFVSSDGNIEPPRVKYFVLEGEQRMWCLAKSQRVWRISSRCSEIKLLA